MASTLVKVDVHIMFHIRSTAITMRAEDLPRIFAYIGGIVNHLGGIPIAVGGVADHVHILASLPKNMSLSDFVKTIKSESSKWIKTLDRSNLKFTWQDGYGAFSVSPSMLGKTINYINNQALHHKRISFDEEYRVFLEKSGVDFDERFAFGD